MSKTQRKIGMLLSYANSLLLVAVNIFLTPFLIKSLGDAEYGVYQMMASFAGYMVLMNFGIGTVTARYLSMYMGKGDKRGERNFIAMSLMITGVLVLLMLIASVALYFCIDSIYAVKLTLAQIEKAEKLFIIIAANMIVTLVTQAYQGIVTAYERFTFNGGWNLAKTLLKMVLVVSLFMIKSDSLIIVSVDLGLSCCYMVMCILYCTLKLKATPKLYKFDKEVFVSAGLFALAMMLQTVINQVNTKVDVTILGIMMGPESVTVYSVAMQVFAVFSSLSTAAVGIYLPKFTKMVSSDNSTGESITREMIAPSRVQTLISGAITFGFLVCGRDFIHMWMGEGYELSWWIAIIIMIPTFLAYTNSVAESVLDAMQKRMVRSVVLACVAVANIIVSIILVHFFGELGAPIGTAITTVIGSLIMNIYYKKVIGIRLKMLFFGIFRGILPCLIIATVLSIPVALLVPVSTWGLFIKGGIFVIVLVVTLMLFGLNKEEKNTVLKPFKGKDSH